MCAIGLFSKYTWVVPLKDKRGISIVKAFQQIISKRKPNKIWVDQCGEFYNNLFKKFFKKKQYWNVLNIQWKKICCCWNIYSHIENKIFKHIAAVSKNVYFDVLDNIADKCNNTVHRSIKKKPVDVTSDSYTEYNEDCNVTKP